MAFKMSDLLGELETASKSYSEMAKTKTQGSKTRRTLESRANGIKHTMELIRAIIKREMASKVMAPIK